MAYRIYAETNEGSYRPAYGHLNKHSDLGWSAKVVAGRLFLDSDGDGAIRWVYITTSKPVTRDELVEGLMWQFRQQCRCEYDCCGHWQSFAHFPRAHSNKKGTRWAVPIYSYRNI